MARARSSQGIRGLLADAALTVRRAGASGRALPDFVILGAQKAGTTSLYRYLSAHPDVVPAARKEVHFFDVHFDRGERWYRAMFPTRRELTSTPRPRLTGEASPYYLFHPLAPARAAEVVPRARLIVLLRDPVERAWSHYRHEVAAGREPLSFVDALAAEPQRLAGAEEAIAAGRPSDALARHRNFSYLARGRYAEQITRWLAHFPRDQFLFLDANELFVDPARSWRRTTEFLDIDAAPQPEFTVHNAGDEAPLDPALRASLEEMFRASNRALEKLLGMPFMWTSDPP